MWLPFKFEYGPEWHESRAAIEPLPERFDEHWSGLTYALKRDPVGWTEGFLSVRGDLRVYRSSDPFFGYELVVFVRVDEPKHVVELKWIELRELAAYEELDEGPQGLP